MRQTTLARADITKGPSLSKTLTPLKAIRKKCINCQGHEVKEVRFCIHEDCPLHSLRMGHGSRSTLQKIRAFCLWCCDGQRKEVELCPTEDCSLWEYRFGRRPQTRQLSSKIGARDGVSLTEGVRVSFASINEVKP